MCGSRDWTDDHPIEAVIEGIAYNWSDVHIIHGNARGADQLAREIAAVAEHDPIVESFPAHWHTYGRAAGPIRNQRMLDAGADLVVAFSDIPITKGTQDMVDRAKKAGVPVWVVSHG